jgi:hypothetical protein
LASRRYKTVTIEPSTSFGIGFQLSNHPFDIQVAAFVLLAGYVLKKLDGSPGPLIIPMILEENARRALLISHGDPTVFVTRPISAAAGRLLLHRHIQAGKAPDGRPCLADRAIRTRPAQPSPKPLLRQTRLSHPWARRGFRSRSGPGGWGGRRLLIGT